MTEIYQVRLNFRSHVGCSKLEEALDAAYPVAQGKALIWKGKPFPVETSKGRCVVEFPVREDRYVIRDATPEEQERIETWRRVGRHQHDS